MTLAELKGHEPPPSLAKLNESDYTVLWHCGFWDGPLSGILAYEGHEYWFEMVQENESEELDQWYRRYAVVALTSEELAREHEVHEDFMHYVWDNSERELNPASPAKLRPKEQWWQFYDKHLDCCRSVRFQDHEAIAWFEW